MNDRKIAAAIKRGNEAAITQVINQYSRLLWPIVSAMLSKAGSVEDVEECIADTFIFLWQNPDKFDPERGKLKTWLCIVARSKATDLYRKLSRQDELPLDLLSCPAAGDLTELLVKEEQRQALGEAINSLAERERELVLRRYCYGQKPGAIAEAMDMPVKQVNNGLYRAKRKLRDRLSERRIRDESRES